MLKLELIRFPLQEKLQELWASIHAFFSEEKYENIFVIVPFDREHIKSAFKSEDFYMKQESYTGEVLKEETKVCFGNDFINKTFSPAVLWQDSS